MDMLEILNMFSPVSIVALVIIIVAGLDMVLCMSNLIPGFGRMAEEPGVESNTENTIDEGSETDDESING